MKTKNKKTGHFEGGVFMLDKPPRAPGRLPQLNKRHRKIGDSELVKKWKELDNAPSRK